MVKNKAFERMRELVSLLGDAARAYYTEDSERMSNREYDRLYDELLGLERETGVVLAGSVTQRVGYEVSAELVKEKHASPMLSLNKTKDPEELREWLNDRTGLLSWKLDGLTIALTYSGGALVKAVTRGDGSTGEVVTASARTFDNIPLTIPFKGALTLRGEAVIRYSDFERINAEIEDADAKYKNPRNLASGSVRQLDASVTARRHVRFYAFALVSADTADSNDRLADFTTRGEQMAFLARQGIDTVEHVEVVSETVEDEVRLFAERAAHTDLPSDGLVLEYDDIAYGQGLGSTAKYPRDAIAFKWADELAETTLKHIEWSASRTGLINPIAVFEPVEIEGTTISRASVHNVSIMEELALGEGDRIRVYKANMIIPQIAENLTRSGMARPPDVCPVCGTSTEVRMSGTDAVRTLHCPNPRCAAKQIKRFTHFVSRGAMNIEGLSGSTLEKLIDRGFVGEYADLFKLARHRDEIVEMEGYGEKSYENLIAAVDTARRVPRARLLYALGIPQIGAANARIICRALDYDWTRIESARADELVLIDGVGEIMAASYVRWFADAENRAVLNRLLGEVTFADEAPVQAGGALDGLTFVITGGLETYANREALKETIEANGGKTTSAVSEKTGFLINNDAASASSKNKKAKALGVKIITETEFNAMLR
jgi:DNA ligase (NAD+)